MVDHLSRIEHKSGDDKKQLPLSETFQDEHLIVIQIVPWYTDIVKYLVS